jgi:copper(I)-binding protein
MRFRFPWIGPVPRSITVVAAIAVVALAAPALGEPFQIADAWVRATPPGAVTAAAYLTITNAGEGDRLLGAASPAARELQLHDHVLDGGMSRMVQLPEIALPAGATVRFEPGAKHVMLLDIAAPLVAGTMVELTLRFATAPPLTLTAPVLDARSTPTPGAAPHR